MFARPVDPFFAYNSAFSAAERHHKEMLAQHENSSSSQRGLGPQQQPYLDNNQSAPTTSRRRKHSLHFEPEFISALDSSLQDPPPVLSRPRPCKKPRRSPAATKNENHIGSTTTSSSYNSSNSFAQSRTSPSIAPETLLPATTNEHGASTTPTTLHQGSSLKITDGPSIIDLSSGEELVAMNVGHNDHKRPRECLSESSSSSSVESLREVFDVQLDGSLCPVHDHAPALPSPAKRSRVDFSSTRDGPFKSLDDLELGRERKRLNRRSTARARNSTSATSNSMQGYRDEPMESAGWMSDDDSHNNTSNTRQQNTRPEMALIRYQGPKAVTLADGVDALIRKRWNDDNDILTLDNLQGNELVLYRPLPQALRDNNNNGTEHCSATIEELDDGNDDIYRSSNDNTDSLIHELEDKIMDMDLD
ncbi:hypothetical protein BGW39_006456 [Mortierella sp. 14UC]|nr:hypothetical protein BGW39_006456 [Mortierella sp. 14UC]